MSATDEGFVIYSQNKFMHFYKTDHIGDITEVKFTPLEKGHDDSYYGMIVEEIIPTNL